ncbi:22016_t:CDS:2 [Gigaspora margarita]|uniref:von willebrand factor type a domain-containing protein n=2 Tax=Gigaspora margarita TaxID=4874 RepID=A0A8H4B413_GIGMA|nr:von willebrand factor type a domain-containing protein [Gigaspora margarita]CAG8516800.1 22016_t:CDS:2 [Gigaspora margarita]
MALVTRSTENTQISCAIKASNELVKNLHRDGLDRGCIATFNSRMLVRQNFTRDEASLYRSLNSLRNYVSGSTRLYDSIVDIIKTFHTSGDRTRPWILVVVTDGDDTGSTLSLLKCASEISRLFTKDSSNFLFLVGVGDDVNSTKMEQMADAGNFIYFPVKDFFLLELVFMTIAHKITTSLSLSLGSLSVGEYSASWAEVQRHRNLSQVAIDYALLIDVSSSMNSIIRPPAPQCFAGHDLKQKYQKGEWWCDVCGKDGLTTNSQYHCDICRFDACSSHCTPGEVCEPKSRCPRRHPLRYAQTPAMWMCDECRRICYGRRLQCKQCDYELCSTCLANEDLAYLMASLLIAR